MEILIPYNYWRNVEISHIQNISQIRVPRSFDCAQDDIRF